MVRDGAQLPALRQPVRPLRPRATVSRGSLTTAASTGDDDPDLILGRRFAAGGRPDLAEPRLRAALRRAPDDGNAHAILAGCLVARDALDEAMSEAREAVRLAPTDWRSVSALADVLKERQRWAEAEQAYAAALRLRPTDPSLLGRLAYIQLHRGRPSIAIRTAEAGLAIKPDSIECLNSRALALMDQGRAAAARESVRSALASRPESAVLHSNLAFMLLSHGDPHEARAEALDALRIDPTLVVAQSNLRAAGALIQRPYLAIMSRARSWWNYRPIWQRTTFVVGLALSGLLSPAAWVIAVLIAVWWGGMALVRRATHPADPLHRHAKVLGQVHFWMLPIAMLAVPYWPIFVGPVAGVCGIAGAVLVLMAAASSGVQRLVFYGGAVVIIAGVALFGTALESALANPSSDQHPSLFVGPLSDLEVDTCLFSSTAAMDARAASAGLDLRAARESVISQLPPPVALATDPYSHAGFSYLTQITQIARTHVDFMTGCASALGR